MRIYLDQLKQQKIDKNYLLLDQNIISLLFYSADFFKFFQDIFSRQHFLIDPYVELEFLRDVFIPELLVKKQEFIKNEEFFSQTANHPDIQTKIINNALALSRIYAHQKQKTKISIQPSIPDLLLAGRCMLLAKSCYIVTEDINDFPVFVFDRINIITFEKSNGELTKLGVLKFNIESFNSCFDQLNKITKSKK